jgi:diaminohydroxyphosphoribosylaminopyrimidine deaminase/5-amino-6-(5-phosphoribosylamino)uracil reductase
MNDGEAMQLALACARSVEGRSSPRPPVGAVVVRHGDIIGRGATFPPYGPHAEVEALTQAGASAADADLYVTLEPCCIHVHTPPCTKAILAAGIRRVVVATRDPNPQVRDQGIAQLRAAGIEVSVLENGQQASEAWELIRPFETYITRGRPHVTAKWAMTLDGKLASSAGDASWISGQASRIWVHDLRDRVDAIIVGANTARVDNPHLTVRLTPDKRRWERTPRQRPPLRIVLATHGQLADSLALLQPDLAAGTCILVGKTCSHEQCQHLAASGVEVVPIAVRTDNRIDLLVALQYLAQRGIMHVLLEGGAKLLGDALDHRCIDSVATFIAPKLIGGKEAPSPIGGRGLLRMRDAFQLQHPRLSISDEDVLIEGDIVYQ